ncbi:Kinesin-like protein NACK2 [Platanthera guangdongensis]|uniref:Kinesin-like protein NACK2 n=1 Tax=Platanthera guangdongensis TaxID=2320717 RepID=A0ABR2MC25_9ASPA
MRYRGTVVIPFILSDQQLADVLTKGVDSPSRWPHDFRKKQRQIIKLWHKCNVSLIHRTYFFLLFKGDPSDSIYMEVELKRLSFLKTTFSQGNPYRTSCDASRHVTLASRFVSSSLKPPRYPT